MACFSVCTYLFVRNGAVLPVTFLNGPVLQVTFLNGAAVNVAMLGFGVGFTSQVSSGSSLFRL